MPRQSPAAKAAYRDSAAEARRRQYNDSAAYERSRAQNAPKKKRSINPFNRIAEAIRGKKKSK